MNHKPALELGYLAVSNVEGLGFCGGLLVVTETGRPIEFHCTTPVAANRAQKILYGSTLNEFLICDQIGAALLGQPQSNPDIVLVNDRVICKLADQSDSPFALVIREDTIALASNAIDSVSDRVFKHQDHTIELFGANASAIEPVLKSLATNIPIDEPFERIWQAINEAQTNEAA